MAAVPRDHYHIGQHSTQTQGPRTPMRPHGVFFLQVPLPARRVLRRTFAWKHTTPPRVFEPPAPGLECTFPSPRKSLVPAPPPSRLVVVFPSCSADELLGSKKVTVPGRDLRET